MQRTRLVKSFDKLVRLLVNTPHVLGERQPGSLLNSQRKVLKERRSHLQTGWAMRLCLFGLDFVPSTREVISKVTLLVERG